MEIIIVNEPTFKRIILSGRLDISTATEFEQRCDDLVPTCGSCMVLDCTGLDYLSSAGLRSLLKLVKTTKQAGKELALCGVKGIVRETLGFSGLDSVIPLYENMESVRNAFG